MSTAVSFSINPKTSQEPTCCLLPVGSTYLQHCSSNLFSYCRKSTSANWPETEYLIMVAAGRLPIQTQPSVDNSILAAVDMQHIQRLMKPAQQHVAYEKLTMTQQPPCDDWLEDLRSRCSQQCLRMCLAIDLRLTKPKGQMRILVRIA